MFIDKRKINLNAHAYDYYSASSIYTYVQMHISLITHTSLSFRVLSVPPSVQVNKLNQTFADLQEAKHVGTRALCALITHDYLGWKVDLQKVGYHPLPVTLP